MTQRAKRGTKSKKKTKMVFLKALANGSSSPAGKAPARRLFSGVASRRGRTGSAAHACLPAAAPGPRRPLTAGPGPVRACHPPPARSNLSCGAARRAHHSRASRAR